MGAFSPSPSRRLCPALPPVRRKKWPNQSFWAIFWIFAPSESHFAHSMPPTQLSGAATSYKDLFIRYETEQQKHNNSVAVRTSI